MKTKIEIKSKLDDRILFEYEKENNTIKDTLQVAVKQGANLEDAYLRGANLEDAYLRGANLKKADLEDANFKRAILCGANLEDAYLRGANLEDASLEYANLKKADLEDANLKCAYIRYADLCGADFYSANLKDVNLYGANLENANLENAYLRGANLEGAKEVPYIRLACPSEGSFIGWKKITASLEYGIDSFLVKLEIPEDALRSSATTAKCRCSKAKVLEITNIKTGKSVKRITNVNEIVCVYKVGEIVLPDRFDENRFVECSHGIHFFINKQDAINY